MFFNTPNGESYCNIAFAFLFCIKSGKKTQLFKIFYLGGNYGSETR